MKQGLRTRDDALLATQQAVVIEMAGRVMRVRAHAAGPQPPPSAFGGATQMQAQHIPPPNPLHPGGASSHHQGDAHSSPFAQAQTANALRSSLGLGLGSHAPMELGNSTGLSSLAAIFSGPFGSDLSKFQSVSGLNFSNFPSLPQVPANCLLPSLLHPSCIVLFLHPPPHPSCLCAC